MIFFGKSFTSAFHCVVSCPSFATIQQRKPCSFSILFWCYLYLKSLLFPVHLKKGWVFPFRPCATATGLINSRAPNPNSSAPAGEPAGPTGLCKAGHFTVQTRGLELQASCPNRQGKVHVQMVFIFTSYLNVIDVISKNNLRCRKKREVRFLVQGVFAKWILREH